MGRIEIKAVDVSLPEGAQLMLGQSHFIKTVEDLYEALATSCPSAKFGIAFCESSGPALVRFDGNDAQLARAASEIALKISSGHSFVVLLKDVYPINVMNRVKSLEEVATVYCATGNPVKVLVADVGEGRALVGVADGLRPKGVESEKDKEERKQFLRKIGYKK